VRVLILALLVGIVSGTPVSAPPQEKPAEPVAERLIYDSGPPVEIWNARRQFIDTWHVLDVLDDMCPVIVAPMNLESATRVTRIEFFAHTPRETATKRIDIYLGTGPESQGTLAYRFDYADHPAGPDGWHSFVPPIDLVIPAGGIGVSFHAEMEFNVYWAPDAPTGAGYIWARRAEHHEWVRQDFHEEDPFVPNMTVRLYGVPVMGEFPSQGPMRTFSGPGASPIALSKFVHDATPQVAENPQVYEYQGTEADMEMFHIIRRQVRIEEAQPSPAPSQKQERK
jgi:hypothetical protein